MIARVWRGWTTPGNADGYETHFRTTVLPHLETVPGHGGAQLLRREADGEIEFVVTTLFASIEAIRVFAGDAHDRAVVAPEAQQMLTRFEQRVTHYDVRLRDDRRFGCGAQASERAAEGKAPHGR